MNELKSPIRLSILILTAFYFSTSKAQEYHIFNQTQVTNNPYLYNPAVAGMKRINNITLSVRQSISQIEGSPRTQVLSFYNRMKNKNNRELTREGYKAEVKNTGMGVFLYNDVDGPFRSLGLSATFSYHLPLNSDKTEQISFGMGPFLAYNSINPKYVNVLDDPLVLSEKNEGFSPDVTAGIHYYGRYAYLGLSSFQIFENSLKYGDDLTEDKIRRKFFINGGGKYKIHRILFVEPSFLLYSFNGKANELFSNYDATLGVYYSIFKFSATYRHKTAISFNTIAQLDQFFVGVSYEYPVTESWRNDYGQAELTVGYNFGRGPNRFGDHRYW